MEPVIKLSDVVHVDHMSPEDRTRFAGFLLSQIFQATSSVIKLLCLGVLRYLRSLHVYASCFDAVLTSFDYQLQKQLENVMFMDTEKMDEKTLEALFQVSCFLPMEWMFANPGECLTSLHNTPHNTLKLVHNALCTPLRHMVGNSYPSWNTLRPLRLNPDPIACRFHLIVGHLIESGEWTREESTAGRILDFLDPFMESELFSRQCLKWKGYHFKCESVQRKCAHLMEEYGWRDTSVDPDIEIELQKFLVYDFMHVPKQANNILLAQWCESMDRSVTNPTAQEVFKKHLQLFIQDKLFRFQQSQSSQSNSSFLWHLAHVVIKAQWIGIKCRDLEVFLEDWLKTDPTPTNRHQLVVVCDCLLLLQRRKSIPARWQHWVMNSLQTLSRWIFQYDKKHLDMVPVFVCSMMILL